MLSEEALNYIHYVFWFLVFISVLLFIMLVFVKNSIAAINLFTVASIAFISIVVASLNLIFMGYVADELNYNIGYSVPLYIVLVLFLALDFVIAYFRIWKQRSAE